jgi:hypothetical protein
MIGATSNLAPQKQLVYEAIVDALNVRRRSVTLSHNRALLWATWGTAPIDMSCEGDDTVSGSLGCRASFFGKNAGTMVVKLAWVAT